MYDIIMILMSGLASMAPEVLRFSVGKNHYQMYASKLSLVYGDSLRLVPGTVVFVQRVPPVGGVCAPERPGAKGGAAGPATSLALGLCSWAEQGGGGREGGTRPFCSFRGKVMIINFVILC